MDRRKLDQELVRTSADAYISLSDKSRLWFAEVDTTAGLLIVEKTKAYLFVDSRYIEYAQKNAKNVSVKLWNAKSLKEFFIKKNYKKVLLEKDYLKISEYDWLRHLLNHSEGVNVASIFIEGQQLRAVKTKEEIKLVEKAIDISFKAFEKAKAALKVGVSEKEIAALFLYEMRLLGADKESFDPIVAFGPNSAEPHHHPTNKKLKDGDIVKFDFGAQYKGFAADITRTFFYTVDKKPNKKLLEIYDIVAESARLGIEAVKKGVTTAEIDKICRDYIESKGYGKYFAHSTGHGLGIDVHELPNVASSSKAVLEVGNIITVEPGIYIEDLGGVRIENDILVTEKGYKILSQEK
ncbi:M24 family metallopeptidase [Mycoplasmopsis agassizii]|uniref:Aminopeptidase P family protein n=1 Tax=Mycoplasmopsis agassizii TaxID=33922 RepID=A0ABX4H5H8_9BACT|nr:aminopeptidase P family protein [Mycoplasmopsis agassizii]PAF55141.1 aminopeptidase P family protein [Mycoplasmopsis agassizii]SMC16731.1 Xaa-Pro aminopeptidase [Mycoplasmopsis agassizii]